MDGYGEFFWKDGSKYFGFYKKDKREGFGIHYQKNRYIYLGFWKDGQKCGFGKIIKDEKIKYGIWKNGKKEKLLEDNKEILDNLKGNKKKYIQIFNWSISEIKQFIGII